MTKCYISISFSVAILRDCQRYFSHESKTKQKWESNTGRAENLIHTELVLRITRERNIVSSLHQSQFLYFILFYPISLEGRQDTIDEFATIPFHLVMYSATLTELAKSILVHSLILSIHLFSCPSLFPCPFTVPCRIVVRPKSKFVQNY